MTDIKFDFSRDKKKRYSILAGSIIFFLALNSVLGFIPAIVGSLTGLVILNKLLRKKLHK